MRGFPLMLCGLLFAALGGVAYLDRTRVRGPAQQAEQAKDGGRAARRALGVALVIAVVLVVAGLATL